MTERNLTQDLVLDRLRLETAAQEQPGLQQYYGEQVANAQKTRDDAENRLSVAQGEAWVRLSGELINGKTATVDGLKALVAKDPLIAQMNDAVSEASQLLKLAQSAERAIEAKKSMIETLQKLYAAGYFSTPSTGNRDGLMPYRPQA